MIQLDKKMWILILATCLLAFSGCVNNQSESIGTNSVTNQDIAMKASNFVKKLDVITVAVAVNNDKEIFLAYKVKHLERFRLKKIEKHVKKSLEEEFPFYQITVSSDLKLFLETSELKEKLSKEKMTSKKLSREIEELKNLLNEKT